MTSRTSRTALFIAVPLLLLMLPLAVWLADAAVNAGEVPRNVTVAGIPVGGLGADDAVVAVRAYEAELQAEPAVFTVNGKSYALSPGEVAVAVDAEHAVESAMNARRFGLLPWVKSFSQSVDVPVTVTVDEAAIASHLEDWEDDAITELAYEGDIAIENGRVTYQYPRDGEALDKDAASRIVHNVLVAPQLEAADLPTTVASPQLTQADIDAAVLEINRIIGEPVRLRNEAYGFELTLVPKVMAEAVVVEIVQTSGVTIEISLDDAVIGEFLEPRREQFEIDPVNADFDVDVETDTVTIIPSKNGTLVDPVPITAAAFAAAATDDNAGLLPLIETVSPEFTTEDAEAFGPLGLVSEFTTRMPGVNRVKNIQLMADTIDGHVVWPDEVFSINEFIGQRTQAKGYLRDGAIIGGEVYCCDLAANIGGGVSQYGTTIFNAIFFGCYEDVTHTPHSLNISRYPEGREATLGYPEPDLAFRNDSAAPVIIRNVYTNSEITVKFYGNTGDRECTAEKGDRFNYSSAPVRYEPNPEVAPGTEKVISKGGSGWSITVTRVFTYGDGRVEREPFTHRYRGGLRTIEVHPCNMANSSLECPIQVPGVVGQNAAAAEGALIAAGFGVAFDFQETTAANAGIVLSQSPGGGSYLDAGATVTIVVGVDNEVDE